MKRCFIAQWEFFRFEDENEYESRFDLKFFTHSEHTPVVLIVLFFHQKS